MVSTSALYCGLDLSTQQLKLTVIDDTLKLFAEEAVNFDRDLPEYGTVGGAKLSDLESTAPTLMWVEAVDLLFGRLKKSGFPFQRIAAISGCGQQHGSVFWREGAEIVLGSLKPTKSLRDQLDSAFTVEQSPIWQDSSTKKQCQELERAVGGAEKLAGITGSSAYERFTGNQIMKLAQNKPAVFAQTERVSLVSSFVASLLLGKYALIDVSDGSGMNLLDIIKKDWDDTLLRVCGCGADMRTKLGPVVETNTSLGSLSSYFVDRYGFSKGCRVVAFTGDNPDSLASLNLSIGDIVVSLGTSDTLFFPLKNPVPSTEGHVLCHPTQEDSYMAMIVYKNGSLVREQIRDRYAEGTWEAFNTAVETTDPGCGDRMGFFFMTPEITPRAKGVFKFENGDSVEEFSKPSVNPRALLESQLMSMRSHAKRIGYNEEQANRRIIITGGASQNNAIAALVSQIFGATVVRSSLGSGSAALGGAYRARFTSRRELGHTDSYQESLRTIAATQFIEVTKGDLPMFKQYTTLLPIYEKLEARVCELGHF
ncbi:hypothetical protein PhCBS80983_g05363 [Powellomyces hirtus]|uniref:Xylulose kinase n=1 Tax=Powellomyces hirtus TaxID=109895 RepID=A0A507DW11_9FUNG|nr:hypothetical protein PhCBS80983_g05363 [Powellomyces hirtus]